jgi:tryptophanyl-tRNA synthetase
MRARRAELEANPDYLEEVLQAGALRATEVAKKTLEKVRTAVGLA